jgi:hypothetical protein
VKIEKKKTRNESEVNGESKNCEHRTRTLKKGRQLFENIK